ncbi:MAG: hypothetical protein PHW04_17135 [Candidatus Wallbacteria bacterium]|nr:hypothetical protein [Candidatus Wallbacteria bacterium]
MTARFLFLSFLICWQADCAAPVPAVKHTAEISLPAFFPEEEEKVRQAAKNSINPFQYPASRNDKADEMLHALSILKTRAYLRYFPLLESCVKLISDTDETELCQLLKKDTAEISRELAVAGSLLCSVEVAEDRRMVESALGEISFSLFSVTDSGFQQLLAAIRDKDAILVQDLLKHPQFVISCRPFMSELVREAAKTSEISILGNLLDLVSEQTAEVIRSGFDSGLKAKRPDVLKYLLGRLEFPQRDFSAESDPALYKLLSDSEDEELLKAMLKKGSVKLDRLMVPAVHSVDLAREVKLETWNKKTTAASPLYYVKSPEVAQYLIDNGHSPNHGNPLAGINSLAVAEVLIRNGAKFKSIPPVEWWDSETLPFVRTREIAELLIKLGCKYDFQDTSRGNYPIHSMRITPAVLGLLLDLGMSPNLLNKNGDSPLYYSTHSVEKARILLEHGADPKLRKPCHAEGGKKTDKPGYTLLHCAWNGDFTRLMIGQGLDPDVRGGGYNETPLHTAFNLDVLKALVEAGADVNARDDLGRTPIFNNHLDFDSLRYLIEKGADPGALDKNGHGVLEMHQNKGVQDYLKSRGAMENPVSLKHNFNLISDPRAFLKALENGGDILTPFDFSSEKDYTRQYDKQLPLLVLLGSNWWRDHTDEVYLDLIREFLDKGGDPNIIDKEGRNLLILCPRLEAARMLEKKGFDLQKTIVSVLDKAVQESRNDDLIRYLLEKGGSGLIEAYKTTAGREALSSDSRMPRSPLICCLPEYVEILCKAGFPPDAQTRDGMTALQYAAGSYQYNGLQKVLKLIAAGADPNSTDKNGNTPLHTAVSYFSRFDLLWIDNEHPSFKSAYDNFLEMLKILRERGCRPGKKNDDGETALDILRKKCLESGIAEEGKIMEIVKLLE